MANRAPRRRKREGTEDAVHLPEGTLPCRFAYLVIGILCIYYKGEHMSSTLIVFCGPLHDVIKWKTGKWSLLLIYVFFFFYNFRPSSLWTSIHCHSNQLKRQKFFRTLGTASVKYWTKNCSVTTEITVNHDNMGLVVVKHTCLHFFPSTFCQGPEAPIHDLPKGVTPPDKKDYNLDPSTKAQQQFLILMSNLGHLHFCV